MRQGFFHRFASENSWLSGSGPISGCPQGGRGRVPCGTQASALECGSFSRRCCPALGGRRPLGRCERVGSGPFLPTRSGEQPFFSAKVAEETQTPGKATYPGKSIRSQNPFVSAEFQRDVRKRRTMIQVLEKIEPCRADQEGLEAGEPAGGGTRIGECGIKYSDTPTPTVLLRAREFPDEDYWRKEL